MIDESIVTFKSPKSHVSEAYRMLRTNLQFLSLDSPAKVFLITSAGPSEGKSTTVANLAVTFAQSGNKVLIIDCDLRKPCIHKIFWITNRYGVTNAVFDKNKVDDYIQKVDVEDLFVLGCGPIPPNPSEILGSNKMKTLLCYLKEIFDIILIDSPPVGMVTDAQILSTLSDGTIIIAESGKVNVDALKRAKAMLEAVNAKILGVILNNVHNINRESNGYYYYYKEYDDGQEVKNNKRKRK